MGRQSRYRKRVVSYIAGCGLQRSSPNVKFSGPGWLRLQSAIATFRDRLRASDFKAHGSVNSVCHFASLGHRAECVDS